MIFAQSRIRVASKAKRSRPIEDGLARSERVAASNNDWQGRNAVRSRSHACPGAAGWTLTRHVACHEGVLNHLPFLSLPCVTSDDAITAAPCNGFTAELSLSLLAPVVPRTSTIPTRQVHIVKHLPCAFALTTTTMMGAEADAQRLLEEILSCTK